MLQLLHNNPDGYGIVFAKDGELTIPETQTFYSTEPYQDNPDSVSPIKGLPEIIDLYHFFKNRFLENKLIFVLSDCEALYIFRNYPGYNISYSEFEEFVGVKTQEIIGNE